MLPANLMLYSWLTFTVAEQQEHSPAEHGDVMKALDFTTLFITLGIVLAAILSGLVAGSCWESAWFHTCANRLGSASGILLILFSIYVSSGGDGATSTFWNQDIFFYLTVSAPCLIGLLLANLGASAMHLSGPERVAIAVECCYQNVGIATSVAITMYPNKEERAQAIAVPLFYGVVEAVACGLYLLVSWRMGWTKAPVTDNLLVVLAKNYQEDEDVNIRDEGDVEQGKQTVDDESTDTMSPVKDICKHTPKKGNATVSRHEADQAGSFLSRLVPRIFRRRCSASGQSVVLHEGRCSSTSPTGTDNDEMQPNRSRFLSADATAATSAPVTPDSSPMPQRGIVPDVGDATPQNSTATFEAASNNNNNGPYFEATTDLSKETQQ